MPRALTREAIVEAAREILVAEGLAAVSLRKVAGKLGVTAPALYAHVRDKRDLLQSIADAELDRMIDAFHAVETDDPVEKIRGHALAYVSYARENPALFKAMFLYQPELMNEPREDGTALSQRSFEVGAAPVYVAIETGRFRPLDPLTTALSLWAAVQGVATLILAGPHLLAKGDEDKLAAEVIDTMLAGLQP